MINSLGVMGEGIGEEPSSDYHRNACGTEGQGCGGRAEAIGDQELDCLNNDAVSAKEIPLMVLRCIIKVLRCNIHFSIHGVFAS